MPYIQRNTSGAIIALLRDPATAKAELVGADHPDVLKFLAGDASQKYSNDSPAADPRNVIATLDSAMIRVLEDLVDVLIQKHVIMLTDLPEKAQRKFLERKETRSTLFGDLGDLSADRDAIL